MKKLIREHLDSKLHALIMTFLRTNFPPHHRSLDNYYGVNITQEDLWGDIEDEYYTLEGFYGLWNLEERIELRDVLMRIVKANFSISQGEAYDVVMDYIREIRPKEDLSENIGRRVKEVVKAYLLTEFKPEYRHNKTYVVVKSDIATEITLTTGAFTPAGLFDLNNEDGEAEFINTVYKFIKLKYDLPHEEAYDITIEFVDDIKKGV